MVSPRPFETFRLASPPSLECALSGFPSEHFIIAVCDRSPVFKSRDYDVAADRSVAFPQDVGIPPAWQWTRGTLAATRRPEQLTLRRGRTSSAPRLELTAPTARWRRLTTLLCSTMHARVRTLSHPRRKSWRMPTCPGNTFIPSHTNSHEHIWEVDRLLHRFGLCPCC